MNNEEVISDFKKMDWIEQEDYIIYLLGVEEDKLVEKLRKIQKRRMRK